MENKGTVHHKKWNQITTNFFRNNHETHVDILQLILCQFRAMVTLCEYSCEINTFRSLMSSAAYSLRFLSLRRSLCSEVWELHICWFIAICWLFVWRRSICHLMLVYGAWDVAKCWSIWCIQEHCPIPVDMLSRHWNSTRPDVFRMATCDVTGTKGLYQGHSLAFWLLVAHLEEFPGYMQSVPEMRATVRKCWSV